MPWALNFGILEAHDTFYAHYAYIVYIYLYDKFQLKIYTAHNIAYILMQIDKVSSNA